MPITEYIWMIFWKEVFPYKTKKYYTRAEVASEFATASNVVPIQCTARYRADALEPCPPSSTIPTAKRWLYVDQKGVMRATFSRYSTKEKAFQALRPDVCEVLTSFD